MEFEVGEAMRKNKREMITFKVDESFLDALDGIPNRSEFIREAVLSALESTCPLCKGSGVLTPNQKEHWEEFSVGHSVEKCDNCNEIRLVCTGTRKKASKQ